MANMSPEKNKMPLLDPVLRANCFDEVATGYTEETALDEAARCLNCKKPLCVEGCPVKIDIPAFIARVREKDYDGAYAVISASSSLPAVCGRVCPQESQCESKCVRGNKGDPVGIGRLERFVADRHIKSDAKAPEIPESNGHKVAVIGSGPAGLTCAGDLARMGYGVTVFEALHVAGGVLVYGIPEFRLPKEIVRREIDGLSKMGVEIKTNSVIGRLFSVDDLFEKGFEAVFISTGAGLPIFMGIEGENLNGVCSANEFLTRVNLMKAYCDDSQTPVMHPEKAVIVGGGNVAMDAARCAKRIGAKEVSIVYRRSEKEMPARNEEIEHAKEEGIIFKTLTNPVSILGEDFKVSGIRCVEMELAEPDASGRRRPVAKENSEFTIAADCVIMALGTSPNPLIRNTTSGLDTDKKGRVIVKEGTCETSREGVFAGGDAVTGAATVILAMGAGKTAAAEIDTYIRSSK